MSIPERYAHQETSFRKQLQLTRMLDTSDPGTGKTRVQLDVHAEHRCQGGKAALVLAPKSLLYPAWVDDAKRFTPHLRLSVATAPNREKGFQVPADMYITNSDAAVWLAQQPSAFFERFDTLILDEITYFKNPTSKRSRAMDKIVKYFPRRYGLTGTPSPNDITDIWHPVFLMDDGERLGTSFFAFRNSTCDPIPLRVAGNPHLKKWVPRAGIEMAVANLIADINIRHKFEDCVDIPPTHVTHLRYDMNARSMREYKDFARTAVLAAQEGYVLGVNKASLINKLFQACSGSVYTNDGQVALLDEQRTDMIVDLVRDRPHTVIFYQWEHQRDLLLERLKKAGLSTVLFAGSSEERGRIARRFQSGLYRVLLAHPQTAGYGLTLTRATSWIWASLTWNLEHYLQGNRRVARAGQTKRTEQVIITANDTIEEQVFLRLSAKNVSQNSILEVLEMLS